LLLGQANLLSAKYKDDYALMLQREYRFLKKKYQLPMVNKKPAFLRMRPAAFPTVRLAQLAMLVHTVSHLFSHDKRRPGN
jgi:predicted ribosome-associated RNA-binding protein Tma20